MVNEIGWYRDIIVPYEAVFYFLGGLYMHYLSSSEIRQKWLEFFQSKGHHVEKGASLIPYDDPTLLWINSGVAALKKYMDGREVPPAKRIVNVQKSIRTNDMDNVGYTSRHHTFFEMLGCFSIGDYFRKEIIAWANEILTSKDYFDLDKDKIYITYNPNDLETKQLWIEHGFAANHLIPLENNYWQIGEGPCGPNTEVFYDRGEKYDPNHLGVRLLQEEIENDRYIEIWGIVFSQYNAVNGQKRSEYKELPNKNIDTGAGLERIASIIQKTDTNFETDLFLPIIKQIETMTKCPYEGEHLIAYRVIADHIRALTFATSDGEVFSNEGRGYVLRRLLRRAMRYGSTLGIKEPFLYKLVKTVIEIYKDFYPELVDHQKDVEKNIKGEEERFLKTLEKGESILADLLKKEKFISGQDAFKLYDTYGFPLDLTKEICRQKGVEVDEKEFATLMLHQKELARSSREVADSMHRQSSDLLHFEEPSTFLYDKLTIKARVIGLFINGEAVEKITSKGEAIFDRTTFYAESGGQVCDSGEIYNASFKAEVVAISKAPNKQHLHSIIVTKGQLNVGDECTLSVNRANRNLTMRNHTATHLLQAAIEKVLGVQVKQMGSYVSKDYLRFDFSYLDKIKKSELSEIEALVNHWVSEAIPVKIRNMPIEEAYTLGAKHFFMDKYGKEVRVVIIGDVSKEFCGGTHLKCTDEIGLFKIVSESSIAAGVRRIEARTSLNALDYIKGEEEIINNVAISLNAKSNAEIDDRLKVFMKDNEQLKTTNLSLIDKLSAVYAKALKEDIEYVGNTAYLFAHLPKENRSTIIKIGDAMKSAFTDYVFIFVGASEERNPLLVAVGEETIKRGINANSLMSAINQVCGGHGGGKPHFAQGSIQDVQNINQAKKSVKDLLS